MNDITSLAKLVFFKAEAYRFERENSFDTSDCPRPHFCLGLVLDGKGVYRDCERGTDVTVTAGDLIFVPIGSRYVSHWQGEPHISYVSMHFIFDYPSVFTRASGFHLQRVTPTDIPRTRAIFDRALADYRGDERSRLAVLSDFYALLADILPHLQASPAKQDADLRILRALKLVEERYREELSVTDLAAAANMSVSRFFPLFRRIVGMTPVEYLNHYRVGRAVILLMSSADYSVEEVADLTGFQSATYFRRVFKSHTGRSPRDYRQTANHYDA